MLRLYSIAEWIAFLSSFLLFAKGIKKTYRLFFFYCLAVVIIEYFGRWIEEVLHVPNHLLFTICCFFFSLFYFFTTRSFLTDPGKKALVFRFMQLFILGYLLNLLFFQRLSQFNSYSFILGYTLLVISCTFFYTEFINREETTSLAEVPEFFIISGYLIYCAVTAILYTIHRYFAYLNIPAENYRSVWKKTNDIANVSLYLLLAVAFLLIWKRRKLLV